MSLIRGPEETVDDVGLVNRIAAKYYSSLLFEEANMDMG